jgi:rhodanese-related sulfurtransferase
MTASRTASRTLDALLAEAEQRIARHSPPDAFEAMKAGALLIDVRPADARERDGIVPGSLHIPRTVLEWRLAPDGAWRSPHVGYHDAQVILICDHGYSTIPAAATVADLGYERAGDVIGGFEAWRDAGLPTKAAPLPRVDARRLSGMAGPD